VNVLLLTGAPGVGKTTVLRKVAGFLPGKVLGGFYTDEIRVGGSRRGFRIVTFDGRERVMARVNLRSPHRAGRYGVDIEAIDAVAATELTIRPSIDVFLVRMKICPERAEALDRNDAPGADVLAAEQRLEALADGVVGRAGKESQEASLPLEQAADGFRDGEGPVSIGHGKNYSICGRRNGLAIFLTAAIPVPAINRFYFKKSPRKHFEPVRQIRNGVLSSSDPVG
jgi:NTPase